MRHPMRQMPLPSRRCMWYLWYLWRIHGWSAVWYLWRMHGWSAGLRGSGAECWRTKRSSWEDGSFRRKCGFGHGWSLICVGLTPSWKLPILRVPSIWIHISIFFIASASTAGQTSILNYFWHRSLCKLTSWLCWPKFLQARRGNR